MNVPSLLSSQDLVILVLLGTLGHLMAAFWIVAIRRKWSICKRTIYDLPFPEGQMRRELRNSLHAPIHCVWLLLLFLSGYFQGRGILVGVISFLLTALFAEIWHYFSHRLLHLKPFHWIHLEHHRSHICTPLTAISFSFLEKLIFDAGLLLMLVGVDQLISLDFTGIAVWFCVYIVATSCGHANFEIQSKNVNRLLAPVFTTTTYHALHHSRYRGNFGLSTRVLDKLFHTEWEDYDRIYEQIVKIEQPLKSIGERNKVS